MNQPSDKAPLHKRLYSMRGKVVDGMATDDALLEILAEAAEALALSASGATERCEGAKAYQVAGMEGAPLYVPVCSGHAQGWFTERDHLVGGMDAECIVCAHAAFPSHVALTPLSAENKASRMPLPPEVLAGALQDRMLRGNYDPNESAEAKAARLAKIEGFVSACQPDAPFTGAASADYEEVLADHRRLVRDIDVILNGEAGAAKQASLCDLIPQIKKLASSSTAVTHRCTCYVLPHADDCEIFVGVTQSGERVIERRSCTERRASSIETSGERRLRHRIEKIDKALDDLGAPKAGNWDGLNCELSQVGRIKALGVSATAATSGIEKAADLCRKRAEDWAREAAKFGSGSQVHKDYMNRSIEAGSLALAIREIPWRETPEGAAHGARTPDGRSQS